MADIAPLAAVNAMVRRFPDLWENIDKAIDYFNGKVSWDKEICYCPNAIAASVLIPYSNINTSFSFASFSAALASWRRGKFIYQFDSSLLDELNSMASDIVIPIDVLYQMPAQCIYIQIESDGKKKIENSVVGFFVHIESDIDTDRKELRINAINYRGDYLLEYIIHLIPGGTINDGINKTIKTIKMLSDTADDTLAIYEQSRKTIIQSIQLVLYICAENADIEENKEQAKIYRKSSRIVDKYREIKKYDVGTKTGVILRQSASRNNYVYSGKSTGTGSEKRTHLRRAHWHHFWTGSGNNRKLVLRWINSLVVNPDKGDTPPTIIKVNDKS